MGAEQSSARDGSQSSNAPNVMKTCYYEVLGVERQATDDEIKKAYRRKALELHPDRNYGKVDSATTKFAEVQSAYEVLADPQERAWYDSHRDSILRGDGQETKDHFEYNIRLTSTRDIVNFIGRFNPSVPFIDGPNGFYTILQKVFTTLAGEEAAACEWDGLEQIQYPEFGGANDGYESVVKPFYSVWMNFCTKKNFSWEDAYRPSDAPDRRTRRLIEKENKRLRDEGIRDFNDAVRSLVVFVRKRDPRYILNSQSEADRQKILRDAAAAQAARSRSANQAKLNNHIVPEWAQSHDPSEDSPFTGSEESEVEHIECVVCGKTFKSERQYETHERSKKHIKAVRELKREMHKENKALNLDMPSESESVAAVDDFETLEIDLEDSQIAKKYVGGHRNRTGIIVDGPAEQSHESSNPDVQTDTAKQLKEKPPQELSDSADTDDEYAPRNDIENRLAGSLPDEISSLHTKVDIMNAATVDIPITSKTDSSPAQKLGKAKAKRAKKVIRQEMEDQQSQEFKCVACNESFASKSKLFSHIKQEKHAQPVPKTAREKNKKR